MAEHHQPPGNHNKIAPAPPPQYEPQMVVKIKQAGSQDSEDGAHITDASDSSDAQAPSALENGAELLAASQRHLEPANGHQEPKQRRLYLAVFGFSVASALTGLALILTWMLHFRPLTGFGLSEQGQLSNLHVLLMYTFMVSLNMYALLIYRTHYARPKQQLKWAHAALTGANMLMALLGVAAMYKAHLIGNMANFYSLHSWIGSLTNGFYLAQFAFGLLAFLRPGLSAQRRAQLMPWHRLAGAALLVLAASAALTGIAELVIFQDGKTGAYASFAPITFIANFAGICVILMTASSVYLLTAAQYRRAPLASERSAAPISEKR